MARQYDSKDDLRAAHLNREFNRAKHSIPMGSTGVFMRVALALIFMYLIVVSNSMLGIAGPVFVSILFLTAFFVPFLYNGVKAIMEQRRAHAAQANGAEAAEVQQEG